MNINNIKNNIAVLLVKEKSKKKLHLASTNIRNCSSGFQIILSIFLNFYLSISPNTISCVPIMVTTSAIICPLDIIFNDCKWRKPGAFILQR